MITASFARLVVITASEHMVSFITKEKTLHEKLERIKTHVKEHRVAYIAATAGFVVGVAVTVIVLKNSNVPRVEVDKLNFKWKSPTTNDLTVTFEARGHLGNPILCRETGALFASQNHAAATMGLDKGAISKHLSGKSPHVNGFTFEKLDLAA